MDEGDASFVSVKTTENPLRLVLLDTGISVRLSPCDRRKFKEVFTAVVLGEVFLLLLSLLLCKADYPTSSNYGGCPSLFLNEN